MGFLVAAKIGSTMVTKLLPAWSPRPQTYDSCVLEYWWICHQVRSVVGRATALGAIASFDSQR